MPIHCTQEFIDHYYQIYQYVKNIRTKKNILFVKGNKDTKFFNISDYDIIYCLPRPIKKKLTNKRHIFDTIYSIPTFVESVSESLNGLWIEKPISGSCGNGIAIVLDPGLWHREKYILQKYIMPLLYKGYKFDIRVLACYCSNGKRYILQDGIMRYASKRFAPDTDPIKHITNISYQKFCSSYHHVQHFPQLLSMMCYYKRLMRKINIIINDILDNIYCKITKTHTFRIIGFDIIFDDNENGYFIECNSMPDIDYANEILKKFIDDNIYKLINYGIKNSMICR